MSATSVIRSARQLIANQAFHTEALEDLWPSLNQHNEPVAQLLYEISREAGNSHERACQLVLPCYLQNSAIHLADDLADGDCDYLDAPLSQGSTALYTLQQLVSLSLEALHEETRRAFITLMIEVGNAQHLELKTSEWELTKARYMAEAMNGKQFQAYCLCASEGQTSQQEYAFLGNCFGRVNHVANDIKSGDIRFTALGEDQQDLRIWAMDAAKEILESDSDCFKKALPPLLRLIR